MIVSCGEDFEGVPKATKAESRSRRIKYNLIDGEYGLAILRSRKGPDFLSLRSKLGIPSNVSSILFIGYFLGTPAKIFAMSSASRRASGVGIASDQLLSRFERTRSARFPFPVS